MKRYPRTSTGPYRRRCDSLHGYTRGPCKPHDGRTDQGGNRSLNPRIPDQRSETKPGRWPVGSAGRGRSGYPGDEFPPLVWESPHVLPARVDTTLLREMLGFRPKEVWYGRETVRWRCHRRRVRRDWPSPVSTPFPGSLWRESVPAGAHLGRTVP